jgi:hypothetical protein
MMRGRRTVTARTCRTAGCRRRGWQVWNSLRYCPSCGRRLASVRAVVPL